MTGMTSMRMSSPASSGSEGRMIPARFGALISREISVEERLLSMSMRKRLLKPISKSSPVYEQLRGQLRDPLLEREGGVEALKGFATAGFLQLRMHLDHVFSGPGVTWLDLDGSHPFDHPTRPFRGLSDHTPLLGHFSIG